MVFHQISNILGMPNFNASRCGDGGLSSLDVFFIQGGEEIIHTVFHNCDPQTLVMISRLSIYSYCVVKYYVTKVWNIRTFFVNWFQDPDGVLRVMERTNALAFGPSVVRYFDREVNCAEHLDICVNLSGLKTLGSLLKREGYEYDLTIGGIFRDDIGG